MKVYSYIINGKILLGKYSHCGERLLGGNLSDDIVKTNHELLDECFFTNVTT
jgi:hypothetical protein